MNPAPPDPLAPEPLLAALRRLHAERAEEVRARWNRSLPFAEQLVDRWERARALGFGEGSSIYDSALVLGEVRVGQRTWIGPHTVLDGSGGLSIGDTCSISAGVHIYTHDSVRWALSGGREAYAHAPVEVGSCTYLGPYTVVSRGVSIGERCLVGAHSFVNRSLPAGSIAFGQPCRVVGEVLTLPDGGIELRYHAAAAGGTDG